MPPTACPRPPRRGFVGIGARQRRDRRLERLRRRLERHQPAGRRQEAAQRILRVDAALDRPADAPDLRLREGQRFAGGDTDHLLDQVEAGDALGDRVLDLERVFISRKKKPLSLPTTNSTVPADW
jgi:hypothetical protein